MPQSKSVLSRLQEIELKLTESLSEVRDLIREVKADNYEVKTPRPKSTATLPVKEQRYSLVDDYNKLTEIFDTGEDQARYFLHHVVPPGTLNYPNYVLTWVCNIEGTEPYIFYITIPPAEMYNRRINALIELKYPITTARFLKSIINHSIDGKLNFTYYNFAGMRYFAINILSAHASVKAKPVTYWFDIKSLDTLDVVHKQSLQHHRGFDFIETFRL